jgi:hypothetical protein
MLPTVLELAHIEPQHSHFGSSFVDSLTGVAATEARHFVCTEGGFRREDEALFERPAGEYALKGALQHAEPELVGKAICLRTREWSYVWRQYEGDELYDRRVDPAETRNLLADSAWTDMTVAAEMRESLFEWLAGTSDVIPWRPDPRFPAIPHGQHTPLGS